MRHIFQEEIIYSKISDIEDGVIVERFDVDADLSRRELQCLKLVAAGKNGKEMSEILGISQHTVDKHLLNARLKLKSVNRVQAVAIAVRRGLIP